MKLHENAGVQLSHEDRLNLQESARQHERVAQVETKIDQLWARNRAITK